MSKKVTAEGSSTSVFVQNIRVYIYMSLNVVQVQHACQRIRLALQKPPTRRAELGRNQIRSPLQCPPASPLPEKSGRRHRQQQQQRPRAVRRGPVIIKKAADALPTATWTQSSDPRAPDAPEQSSIAIAMDPDRGVLDL